MMATPGRAARMARRARWRAIRNAAAAALTLLLLAVAVAGVHFI
jgi:hypothetical protein